MELSKTYATKLVEEINNIIDQKINIISPKGTIIASTDTERIGTFHGGAYQLIMKNLNEIVIENDNQYVGAKAGTNFPILFEGKIIGVLGITGNYNEIITNAKIIKRMTEMLIQELAEKQSQQQNESVKSKYMYEWLHLKSYEIDDSFIQRGMQLGIDLSIKRRILTAKIIHPNNDDTLDNLRIASDITDYIKGYLPKIEKDAVFIDLPNHTVLSIIDRHRESINQLCELLSNKIKKKFGAYLVFGIASRSYNFNQAKIAYKEARKALHAAMRNPDGVLRYYDSINMELFVEEVSVETKREYIKKIFYGYEEQELQETINLLNIYYNNEGSINSASEKLFLHKNTLQNRLKKIAQRTGYDPRSIKYSSLFFNAIYFYNDINGKMN